MNAVTQPMGPCPCNTVRPSKMPSPENPDGPWEVGGPGCGIVGTKLQKNGHLKGCLCRSCIGRRNRRNGQKTEAKRHRRLGGQGQTPRDELAYSYSLNVTTEDKHGKQIPQNFLRFIGLDWTRHALRQAEKKLPIGSDSLPSLFLDCGKSGTWLLVQIPPKGLR